jgi:hypothetical protein
MRFPSIRHVRALLASRWRDIRRTMKPADLIVPGEDSASVDVRLQVWDDGSWNVHTGDASYDQDHRGWWGVSCLSWERQDLTALARDLIEQAREHEASAARPHDA